MIARLVEDWLTKVNERQLEVPFTYLLLAQGHKVVHLTRHGETEQGKDIISIDATGTACAFQLKGAASGKIRQSDWDEFLPQIGRLVELPIKHPAIEEGSSHKAFLVTNGELDEPVRIEILDRNKQWEQKFGRKLDVIVKGQILSEIQGLQSDFWPSRPSDVRTLLEHYLADGKSPIDKASFFSLLWGELAQSVGSPATVIERAIASSAIMCAFAVSPFVTSDNHLAVCEAWILFAAAVLSLVHQEQLSESKWSAAVGLAEDEAFAAIGRLWVEVRARMNLFEGNVLVEAVQDQFYRARTTLILGFIGAWAIRQRANGADVDDSIVTKLEEFEEGLWLWGESAVPLFLSWFWFKGRFRGGVSVERILLGVIRTMLDSGASESSLGLPDPYHPPEEIISALLFQELAGQESFAFRSYTLESLIHLATIRLWRQQLAGLWPAVSHFMFAEFDPEDPSAFYSWHSEKGRHVTRVPRQPESWARLKAESSKVGEQKIPEYLRKRPWLLLLFVLVYPHRLTPDVTKFIDRWARSL